MTDEDILSTSTTTSNGKEVFIVPAPIRGECNGCIGDRDNANRGWCRIKLCHYFADQYPDGGILIPADPQAYEEYKSAYVAFKLDGNVGDLPTWDERRQARGDDDDR